MFAWNTKPITESYRYNDEISINSNNYTEEGGLLQAFEESYTDMSNIEIKMANYNNACVKVFAEAYHNNGSMEAGEQAVRKFQKKIMREGFFSDIKDSLINLLKKLKEKIIAFFKAARQYLDSWLLSEAKFAEKYEDKVGEKTLTNFKYEMYDYNLQAIDFKQAWSETTTAAKTAAKGADVAITESFNLPRKLNWINDFRILCEAVVNIDLVDSKKFYSINGEGRVAGSYILTHKNLYSNRVIEEADKNENSEEKPKETPKPDEAAKVAKVAKAAAITEAQKKVVKRAVYSKIAGEDVDTDKSSKFEEAIKKKLRGGRKEKKEIHPDMDKVIDGLKEHKEILSDVDDAREAAISGIDELIDKLKDKDYNDEQKAAGDQVKDKNTVAIFQICKNAYTTLFNIYKDIVKERGSAYKSCLLAALRYHDDDED